MRRWLALGVLVLVACATPDSGLKHPATMAGPNWAATGLTLQRYSDGTKWRCLLRLRDVSGTGLHLTRLVRSFPGIDFFGVPPQSATIDLKIEPNGLLEIPCWETLYRGSGAHRTSSDL